MTHRPTSKVTGGSGQVAHAQAEHDQMEMVAKLEEMREREV